MDWDKLEEVEVKLRELGINLIDESGNMIEFSSMVNMVLEIYNGNNKETKLKLEELLSDI